MSNLLFNDENVLLQQDLKTWEECVRAGCQLLEDKDLIESEYADNIIDKVNELGPYIVLCDDFAMPHARPEEGVKSLGYSLITLKKPVDFKGKDVSIVLTLAAPDNDSHIDLLQKIVEIANGDKLARLKDVETLDELNEILEN